VVVRLTVLVVAGVLVVLFATQWNRWVGDSSRQTTDDAGVRGNITPLSARDTARSLPAPVAAQPDDPAASRAVNGV
jgi:hypothetical protein